MKKEVDIFMNKEKHIKNEFICWLWIVKNVDCEECGLQAIFCWMT